MANKIYLREEIAGQTEICLLDEKNQQLYYRGIELKHLIDRGLTFDEVAHFLIFGKTPKKDPLHRRTYYAPISSFKPVFNIIARTLHPQFHPRANAHPMDILSGMVRVLGNESNRGASSRKSSEAIDRASAIDFIFDVGYLTGILKRWFEGKRPLRMPKVFGSTSKNILYQMFGIEPDEFEERLMDIALILYAEHEFNASTFVVRVAASAHTDIFSAVVAGISTLRGSRHGGANEDAMNLMLDIGDPDKTKAYLDRFLETPGAKVPGFGHAVYTISDPRVAILKPYVKELSERKHDMRWYEMGLALEEYMAKRAAEKGRSIPANVDLWTAPLYHLMGIPIRMYTPLFAASRVAGWCAHYLEVIHVTKDAILRPRAEYIGPDPQP